MGLQSFIGKIFGSGIKEAAEGVSTLALGIRTAITGVDPQKAAELEKLALEADRIANNAQAEINKVEAGSKSLFVAGWRPFIGWVCGSGLAFHFIFSPIFMWLANIFAEDPAKLVPPTLNVGELMTLTLALLGLGGYRTYEKFKGVGDRH